MDHTFLNVCTHIILIINNHIYSQSSHQHRNIKCHNKSHGNPHNNNYNDITYNGIHILDNLIIPDYCKRTLNFSPNMGIAPTTKADTHVQKREQILNVERIYNAGPIFATNIEKSHEYFKAIDMIIKDKDLELEITDTQKKIQSEFMLTKQFFSENTHIITIPADKGNKNIICLLETFNSLRNDFINNNTTNGTFKIAHPDYNGVNIINQLARIVFLMGTDILNNGQQIQQDESNQQQGYQMRAHRILDSNTWIPTIDPNHMTALRSISINLQPTDLLYRPATLTGLIKIHKQPVKFRPVIDMSDTIAAPINRWALSILQYINDKQKRFAVLNSNQTVDIIKRNIPNEYIDINFKIRSLDFESMYTNIPINAALETLEKTMTNMNQQELQKLLKGVRIYTFVQTIKFLTSQNNAFMHNDNVYFQQKGLIMGASLSPVLASIFLEQKLQIAVDSTIVNNNHDSINNHDPTTIILYADDLLFIGPDTTFTKIRTKLAEIIPSMPTTTEEACELSLPHTPPNLIHKSIRFLEMMIVSTVSPNITNRQRISHIWSPKEYDSGRTINYHSYSNMSVRKNAIVSKLCKIIKLTSTQHLRHTLDIWWKSSLEAQYPKSLIKQYATEVRNNFSDKSSPTTGILTKSINEWTRKLNIHHAHQQHTDDDNYNHMNNMNNNNIATSSVDRMNINNNNSNNNNNNNNYTSEPIQTTVIHTRCLNIESHHPPTVFQPNPNNHSALYHRFPHSNGTHHLQKHINRTNNRLKISTKPTVKISHLSNPPRTTMPLRFITNVVVTHNCVWCDTQFISLVNNESVTNNLIWTKNTSSTSTNQWIRHYSNHHQSEPQIPSKVKIISKRYEKSGELLAQRFITTITTNPHLIPTHPNPSGNYSLLKKALNKYLSIPTQQNHHQKQPTETTESNNNQEQHHGNNDNHPNNNNKKKHIDKQYVNPFNKRFKSTMNAEHHEPPPDPTPRITSPNITVLQVSNKLSWELSQLRE